MIENSKAQQFYTMISVKLFNQLAMSNLTPGFDYLELKWYTKRHEVIIIGDMNRSRVQNTLNWCIQQSTSPFDDKDGVRYQDWIVYFTMRLLDPALE